MEAFAAPPPPRLDWAYFLDVDGTLLEIAEAPERVRVAPELVGLLEALYRGCGGALALISGRQIEDIDRLFWPLRLPAAGIHGLERRRPDGTVARAAAEGVSDLHASFADFAARDRRLRVEDKGVSLALHYRLAPELGESVRDFARALVAADPTLRLLHGKMVVEIYRHRTDKGQAIQAFMAEPPFLGRRAVFAGDDVTDEYGFRAVRAMGGLTVRVGLLGDSSAACRLPSVPALHAWLQSALHAAPRRGVALGPGAAEGTTGAAASLCESASPMSPSHERGT